jgi:hypothetical protein
MRCCSRNAAASSGVVNVDRSTQDKRARPGRDALELGTHILACPSLDADNNMSPECEKCTDTTSFKCDPDKEIFFTAFSVGEQSPVERNCSKSSFHMNTLHMLVPTAKVSPTSLNAPQTI